MSSMASTGSSAILTMFGGSNESSLLYWWQADGTKPWNQETVGTDPLGFGWPAITWTGNAAVIAAVDGGGNLYYWWQAAGTKPWRRQHVASGVFQDQPATIAWTGSGVVIAAVDDSNNIQYWWQAAGTAPLSQQLVARGWGQDCCLGKPLRRATARPQSRRQTVSWASLLRIRTAI